LRENQVWNSFAILGKINGGVSEKKNSGGKLAEKRWWEKNVGKQ